MSNKSIAPTVETVSAANNFADWLRSKMDEKGVTCSQLAKALGYERKAIVAYRRCQTSPKLDTPAAIFAYFGEDRITIEINPRREEADK